MLRGLFVQLRGSEQVRLTPRPLGGGITVGARVKLPK